MDAMDLDIDMDVDHIQDEPHVPEPQVESPIARSPGEIEDEPPSQEFDSAQSNTLIPTKVYLRGLDTLNPEDIKNYVAEHFSESSFDRVEWIDDSSANLTFKSQSIAQDALVSLSAVSIADPTQLPPGELLHAKPFSKKPDIQLQLRFALESDRKQPGAASRSRFYLLNPEYDPEERRRRNETRKYRDRDGEGTHRRGNRRDGRDERDERDEDPPETFDVNLYDDNEAALATRVDVSSRPRRRSYTPLSDEDNSRRERSYRDENRKKELFPDKPRTKDRSFRDRSASPPRGGDGDRAMDDGASDGSAGRNRRRAQTIKNRLVADNRGKELFPTQVLGVAKGRLGDKIDDAARSFDSRLAVPLMDGVSEALPTPRRTPLADRVSTGSERSLADRISRPEDASEPGFSIRGVAGQREGKQGFSIKGNAGKSIKELFPEKFGSNAEKELFAERLEGRSRRRQKAEDLFH